MQLGGRITKHGTFRLPPPCSLQTRRARRVLNWTAGYRMAINALPNRPVVYLGNRLRALTHRVGDDDRLDGVAHALERVTAAIPRQGHVKDVLSGTWLDHPLHPMLTDLPIGF